MVSALAMPAGITGVGLVGGGGGRGVEGFFRHASVREPKMIIIHVIFSNGDTRFMRISLREKRKNLFCTDSNFRFRNAVFITPLDSFLKIPECGDDSNLSCSTGAHVLFQAL
jgi:hypothetical protein